MTSDGMQALFALLMLGMFRAAERVGLLVGAVAFLVGGG